MILFIFQQYSQRDRDSAHDSFYTDTLPADADGKQNLEPFLKGTPLALPDNIYQNTEETKDGVDPAKLPSVYLHPGNHGNNEDGIKPKGKSRASVPVKYHVNNEGVSGISPDEANNTNITSSMPNVSNTKPNVYKNVRGFGMPVVQEFKDLIANVKKEKVQEQHEPNYENEIVNDKRLSENDTEEFYSDTRVESNINDCDPSEFYEDAESPRANIEGIMGANIDGNTELSQSNDNSGSPLNATPGTNKKHKPPKTSPKPAKLEIDPEGSPTEDQMYEDAYSHTNSPTQILQRSQGANSNEDGYLDSEEGAEDSYVNESFHGNRQNEAAADDEGYEEMEEWRGDGIHPALKANSYLQVI